MILKSKQNQASLPPTFDILIRVNGYANQASHCFPPLQPTARDCQVRTVAGIIKALLKIK
jgi:hypothetical protein